MTIPTPRSSNSPDRILAIWSALSAADRIVLLGHDRDDLTSAEKSELMGKARALAGPGPAPRTVQELRPERRKRAPRAQTAGRRSDKPARSRTGVRRHGKAA